MADINMFQKLPCYVYLQNKKYKINVDFRHIIQIENKIKGRSEENTEKICWCLEHFYPFFYNKSKYILITNPELFKEAFQKFIWFYKCGRDDYHKSSSNGGKNSSRDSLNYEYDDEYIAGAFWEKYRIDTTTDKVHWWKFKAMFKALKEDNKIVEIMGYRAIDLTKIKDKSEREKYRKLKKLYALPDMCSEEEKERDFNSAFSF